MPSPPHTTDVNSSDVPNSQIHQYNNINRDLEENGEEKDVQNNGDTDVIDVDDDSKDEEEEDDDDDEDDDEEEEEEEDDEDDDEDESMSQLSSGDEADECENKEEFVLVRLADIRKEVQCPICLGIIRKTRTVMECLHRFCRECIDKSMRLGNNECPACRTHCASRRSLRDDPNYDALIAAIYPDIDQYEEEELSYQEDEKARNMQIQAAIAQTFRRQTEALSKKRKRSHATYRRRRNYKSEDEEEANAHDAGKDFSSQDERSTEVRSRRPKRWKGNSSAAGASGDGGVNEHDQEVNKEATVTPVGWVGSSEMLAWGKGGLRSNTRHGSGAGGNGKHSRSRLAKLSDHLRNLKENESEMEIQVVLISLDQQRPSALQHSFLSSRPALSVGQLCQYISVQTSLPPDRVEILAAKGPFSTIQGQVSSSCALQACNNDLQVLDTKETLGGLRATTNFSQGHLTLAYRQKAST